MAKMAKRYEDAVMAMLTARANGAEPEMTESALTLINCAYDCDSTQRSIIEAAQHMAEVCAHYAREIARGRTHTTPPTDYSDLRDMPGRAKAFEAKEEALFCILRLVYGRDAEKTVRESLKAAAATAVAS